MRYIATICITLLLAGCGGKTASKLQTDVRLRLKQLGWEQVSVDVPESGYCEISAYREGFRFHALACPNKLDTVEFAANIPTQNQVEKNSMMYGVLHFENTNISQWCPYESCKAPNLSHDRLKRAKALSTELIQAYWTCQ